ncbi:hypothetical protein ACFY7C_19580 [Streptomyces sp. NPDC012769]|uniref:hypothetical protein n=1 Tax=Streptomyces sp. NPDC012769 TaxID=3364848 RepID=UPI00367CD7D1
MHESPSAITITGVDLHDGTINKVGETYYMYGTMYGCGFNWGVHGTPWCGFGVSKSTDMRSWTQPKLLFSPDEVNPWSGLTWKQECGGKGHGCFNPRMIQRTGWGRNDGASILWFNSPYAFATSGANAYNVMGCNSPEGPCGRAAGKPFGSYNKPRMTQCAANGDFSIVRDSWRNPVLFCTAPGSSAINSERLDWNGANGAGEGLKGLAGLKGIESPGVWKDPRSGRYVMTYSDPNCGYCTGTGTGYAVGSSLTGQFEPPKNLGFSPPATGRRAFSATSCGGQPRTVTVLDGQPWQWIDLWTGERNQARAGIRLEPLNYAPNGGQAGDGGVWKTEVGPYQC